MKCPNCENNISDTSLFCAYCGSKVDKKVIPLNRYTEEDDDYDTLGTKDSLGVQKIVWGLLKGVKSVVSWVVSATVTLLLILFLWAPLTGKLDGLFNGAYGSVNHNPNLVTWQDIGDAINGDADRLKSKIGFTDSDDTNGSDENTEKGLVKGSSKESKNTTIESGIDDLATDNKRDKTGLSTIIIGKYEITIPDNYDYVSNEEIEGRIQHYVFQNRYDSKDYFSIDILEKGEESPEDLIKDSEYWMKYDLDNGARLNNKMVWVGEFEGIMAVYDNDNLNDYRISSFLVNDKDRCILILYGMKNPMDVFEKIEIYGV